MCGQQAADKTDGGEHHASEDLFAVHDFDIKIDLDVPSGEIANSLPCLITASWVNQCCKGSVFFDFIHLQRWSVHFIPAAPLRFSH